VSVVRLDPPRFETGRPRLMAGLRERHGFDALSDAIPGQWARFNGLGRLPGQVGDVAYGVICGADHEARTLEYMCAVEVESFDALPAGTGRLRLPPARYAVFTHRGHVSGLKDVWTAIMNDWLPASGCEPAQTPDFELYDERFDPATGEGEIEIWIPVA
jgi:AraC family transcriptional regulator